MGRASFALRYRAPASSFSCRSKDVLLDLDEGMHWSVVWDVLVMTFVTEPEVSACLAPCFWGYEVGGITVKRRVAVGLAWYLMVA